MPDPEDNDETTTTWPPRWFPTQPDSPPTEPPEKINDPPAKAPKAEPSLWDADAIPKLNIKLRPLQVSAVLHPAAYMKPWRLVVSVLDNGLPVEGLEARHFRVHALGVAGVDLDQELPVDHLDVVGRASGGQFYRLWLSDHIEITVAPYQWDRPFPGIPNSSLPTVSLRWRSAPDKVVGLVVVRDRQYGGPDFHILRERGETLVRESGILDMFERLEHSDTLHKQQHQDLLKFMAATTDPMEYHYLRERLGMTFSWPPYFRALTRHDLRSLID